jgi:hypothetical protein
MALIEEGNDAFGHAGILPDGANSLAIATMSPSKSRKKPAEAGFFIAVP